MTVPDTGAPEAPPTEVLVVDLDETLVQSDMLHEGIWSALSRDGRHVIGCFKALRHGKAALKSYLVEAGEIDVTRLPYDARILARLEAWRAAGGRTALVTATDHRIANRIAAHLGLFDEVHGTTPAQNLKGAAKAAVLAEQFGDVGYVYIGDSAADLPVWAGAVRAISVGASAATRRALDATGVPAEHLPPAGDRTKALLKALRPHQWLKNALVLVPLIADPNFALPALGAALLAFVALSLAASAGYVLNDLLDLGDDRSHPRKCRRPFASGALSARHGTLMVPVLLLLSLGVALLNSAALAGVVMVYFIGTTAYSVKLKRHTMVDICTLAFLFTLRILAGGVAIATPLSMWLLAFSIFIFLSLAAIKRLAELTDIRAAGRAASRRGYRVEDSAVLSQVALSSGYLAVLVFALYINEPVVSEKFGAPLLLWGVCPFLLFWVSRMTLVATRGEMHDDPLVFTLQNRTSRKVVIVIAALLTVAVLA
jgi:4-hydroxybenzoate polyprenyltransferase